MAELIQSNQINTIIVLRNDTKEAWETQGSYILKSGEVGVGYMSVEVKDSNGTTMTDPETNAIIYKKVPIVKIGDGIQSWAALPQAEGVFTDDVIITSPFGRHTIPTTGSKNTGGKGMTTSEWLLDALSESKNPSVTYPTCSMSISVSPSSGEVGTTLSTYSWDGKFTDGSYQYGISTNKTANAAAGTTATWSITDLGGTSSSDIDKSSIAVSGYSYRDSDDSPQSISITASATLNLKAAGTYVPVNNLGQEVPAYRIDRWATGISGATYTDSNMKVTFSPSKTLTGYRKPFWGWKSTALALANPAAITSEQVRALPSTIIDGKATTTGGSGSSNGGLPTSLTVPAGTKQIYFAAKAGTKSSLTVKNTTKEPATGVACTKIAKALKVNGANNYKAVDYDLWYIDLDAAFTAETKLSLTWA